MTPQDKRCGNCKWWEVLTFDADLGRCKFALPDSAMNHCKYRMHATQGICCPCWTAKETSCQNK